MILYHGTNACFDVIDLAKSNRYDVKDGRSNVNV